MACLEMYNSEHKGAPPPMSPRISFSNDFAESHSQIANNNNTRSLRSDAPISSDFEFSVVSNNSKLQLSADELFFKGRILPMKEKNPKKFHKPSPPPSNSVTTLRDELLAGDDEDEEDDDGVFSLKPPQSKGRWKGFLGLRKSHIGSKKTDLAPHTNFFSFPLQDQPTTPQGILEEESADASAETEMKM